MARVAPRKSTAVLCVEVDTDAEAASEQSSSVARYSRTLWRRTQLPSQSMSRKSASCSPCPHPRRRPPRVCGASAGFLFGVQARPSLVQVAEYCYHCCSHSSSRRCRIAFSSPPGQRYRPRCRSGPSRRRNSRCSLLRPRGYYSTTTRRR